MDQRYNDYENQPSGYPASQGSGDQNYNRQQVNFADPRQNMSLQRGLHPPQGGPRTSDRSSVSSRASSTSGKDPRPQSAYYDAQPGRDGNHASQDAPSSRPRSEDVSASKLREWQDKYSPGHSPPYSNIGPQRDVPPQPSHAPPPKPSARERLFAQQNAPPPGPQKVANNAYSRQPNFYENTAPLQQELPPAFHQLQRPPTDAERGPKVAPKPAPKRNYPRVQPVEVPQQRVDNRQTQPHFYGDRQPSSPSGQPGNQFSQQQQQQGYQRGQDPRVMPDLRNGYEQHSPDPRNGHDPRLVNTSRNGPDPRTNPDPRTLPDMRNVPDSRNGPAPRHTDPRTFNDRVAPPQQGAYPPHQGAYPPQDPQARGAPHFMGYQDPQVG